MPGLLLSCTAFLWPTWSQRPWQKSISFVHSLQLYCYCLIFQFGDTSALSHFYFHGFPPFGTPSKRKVTGNWTRRWLFSTFDYPSPKIDKIGCLWLIWFLMITWNVASDHYGGSLFSIGSEPYEPTVKVTHPPMGPSLKPSVHRSPLKMGPSQKETIVFQPSNLTKMSVSKRVSTQFHRGFPTNPC